MGTKVEAAKGDPYDVFVVLPPYQDALNSGNLVKKDGKIVGAFILAITVKKGSPLPDISSAAAVKKDLLGRQGSGHRGPDHGQRRRRDQ